MTRQSELGRSACVWLALLCFAPQGVLRAQNDGRKQSSPPSIGKTGKQTAPPSSIGKTGRPLVTEENKTRVEQGRAFAIPVIKRVPVAPNEGYLALFTVPGAKAVLRPLTEPGEARPLPPKAADDEGLINFPRLAPGKYRLEITCPDYEQLTDTVDIRRGQQTARAAPLRSLFATLRVGLGAQATADVTTTVNQRPLSHARIEQGQLVFERVPVGKQTFTFSKPDFVAWTQEYEIRPGENSFSGTLNESTIALTIRTEPNAEVYLDNDAQRPVPASGELTLDVLPSARRLRVKKPGFEPVERELKLSPANRVVTENVPLVSILDDVEFDDKLDPAIRNWWPVAPLLRNAMPKGRELKGDAFVLACNTTKPQRDFNIYGDFTLSFSVRFTNGKGAAWVVRAQREEPTSYYLFELDRPAAKLKLYVCRAGKCDFKTSEQVLADLTNQTTSYTITLVAAGNTFSHTINTPKGDEVLGGRIKDDAFPYGGVGLRAFNGAELLVQEFHVKPGKARP